MENPQSAWSIKDGRPDSIPGCQNVSSLPHLPDGELSCSAIGLDKCYYFRCRTCMPFLALDHYNRDYKQKIEYIPRIDSIKPKFGLFDEDSGYVGEVMDFYGAYLSQIDGLKGVAVYSWRSENAKLFFDGIDKTFVGTDYKNSKNFEIDWILFTGNTLNVIEVSRRNPYIKQTDVVEQIANADDKADNESPISKGIKKLVKEKIKQIRKDQIIVKKLLAATNCENLQVNYCLFLPTIPFEVLQKLLVDLKPPSKMGVISSDVVSKQQVYSYDGDGILSSEPIPFKGFVSNGSGCESSFAYLTASAVISMLLTCKPESTSNLPLDGHCSEQDIRVMKQSVGLPKDAVLEFPKTLVFGPEQDQAIRSNTRVVLMMGEPGSGKTTVLLALLFKYTGKHVKEKKRKKVVFSIPPHKATFRDDIYLFIKEFCLRDWVDVVIGLDKTNVGRNTGATIYLFDEIYDAEFLSTNLNVGKIYAVLIPGEKMTFRSDIFLLPRPDYEIFFFRRIYRSPTGLSKVCTKLKRLLDKKRFDGKIDYRNQGSIYERIPWEMSTSSRPHMNEASPIDVKSYESLHLSDLSEIMSDVNESDFIVTLNLKEDIIEKLGHSFKANKIFHQNTKQPCCESELIVRRTDPFDFETIVLVCGMNFTIDALKSQSWLHQGMKLKEIEVFLICHDSIKNEVKTFLRQNLSTEVQPFPSCSINNNLQSKCNEMSSKLQERNVTKAKVLIVTFNLELDVAECVASKFEGYVNHHMNLRLSGSEEQGNHLPKRWKPEGVANLEEVQEVIVLYGWNNINNDDIDSRLRQQFLPFCFQNNYTVHFMAREISVLNRISTDSEKLVNFWNLSSYAIENCLELLSNFKPQINRLIISVSLDRAIEECIRSIFKKNSQFVHFWGSSVLTVCSDETGTNVLKYAQSNEGLIQDFSEKYSHVIFLDCNQLSSFSVTQLRKLVPPVRDSCHFIHVGYPESYQRLVKDNFNLNGRPFVETICYSNSTDVAQLVSTIPCLQDTQSVFRSWNLDQSTFQKIRENFVILDISESPYPVDNAHDLSHLVLVCGQLTGFNHMGTDIVETIEHFNVKHWIFVVCHEEDNRHIQSVLSASKLFYLFTNRSLCKDLSNDDNVINSIPLFEFNKPDVLLLTSNLDRNIAPLLTDKFRRYRVRHIDAMPWASDSLSFTGSEFDRVVLLCDGSVDIEARETLSVLYTTLSRSKQKALVICHQTAAERMRSLLSLSSVDQVFEQLRSSVNLGENILSSIHKDVEVLEVFEKVIVTKNENQFNSMKLFIEECKDPEFDWVFNKVRSMLMTCFPCGLETASMLNKFLLWRPTEDPSCQVLHEHDFFFQKYMTVEERKKILECIDPQFRRTNFEYDRMEVPSLKSLAFTAVTWNQLDMLSQILSQLGSKIQDDDEFYRKLLFSAIVWNDCDCTSLILKKVDHCESRLNSLLINTAPFVSVEIFSMLLTSVAACSETSASGLRTTVPQLASTTSAECFEELLSFLSVNSTKFDLIKFRDRLRRNLFMSAVSNTEIFRLLLARAPGKCDSCRRSFLLLKDGYGWSCLRHACNADNIDVVRILVDEYACCWFEDEDLNHVGLMEFVKLMGRNHIKKYLYQTGAH